MKFRSCWQIYSTPMICFQILCSSDFYAIYISILYCSASKAVAIQCDVNNISLILVKYQEMEESIQNANHGCFLFWFENGNKSRCLTQARHGSWPYLFILKVIMRLRATMGIKLPDIICRILTSKERLPDTDNTFVVGVPINSN